MFDILNWCTFRKNSCTVCVHVVLFETKRTPQRVSVTPQRQGRLTPHYGWEINPPSDTVKHT